MTVDWDEIEKWNRILENNDWRDNPIFVEFLDAMLLSLIRAHPEKSEIDDDERTRLNKAKNALFAFKASPGMRTENDVPELVWMAKQYLADRGGSLSVDDNNELVWGEFELSGCRALRKLANEAYEWRSLNGPPHRGNVEQDSYVRRLERKFKEKKYDLLLIALRNGDVGKKAVIYHVEKLRESFALLGIPVEIPEAPDRDLNTLL